MSYSTKLSDFEIIDFKTVYNTNKTLKIENLKNNQFNNAIYTLTQNGFLIVFTEENSHNQNFTLLNLFNNSIISFFKKRYYRDSQKSIETAFSYANKKLFYSSKHNFQFAGRNLNSLIVLIKDKKVFFGSIGKTNLFIKTVNGVERLTPKQEDFENYQFTEIRALKSSDLEQELIINTNNSPFYPFRGDVLLIASSEYSNKTDDIIIQSFESEERIEKNAFKLFTYFSENQEISKPDFVIVKLDFKGGNYSNRGTIGFYYENLLQKILDTITSVPVLIFLAVFVIFLFVIAFKKNLIF